jgi:hypothetical protein
MAGCRGADAVTMVVGVVFCLLAGTVCAGLFGARAAALCPAALCVSSSSRQLDLDRFERLEHQN